MYTIDLTMVIIMGTTLIGLIALGVFVLIGMKIAKGGRSSKGLRPQDDEVRMIQEIYQGLARMEQRVEALETILVEREKESRQ
jgi:phage shock protein B